MQYTDHVSQKWTLETCVTLLTNVTPIHLIQGKEITAILELAEFYS